ncbi:MAG: 30S ribosomal protein S3 [Halofilum sp. (in: g-proteobacteria)]|nr:30S ribosomal protein S3 [Halofilum sp. (in: g-proteobacteria)]
MGHKVHPVGIRLGISADWNSTWYANNRDYAGFLNNDIKIREFIGKELAHASVSRIQIDRPARSLHVTIHTARPGIVIGKKGEDIERLRRKIADVAGLNVGSVKVNIAEIRKPELDAKLVADNVAQQLERRVMFRRAMKRVVTNTMRLGAQGVKIHVAGRLNGAEIARREWYHDGRVPLHTLRADIDYGLATANTTYGSLGIKVWICKGEVFDLEQKREAAKSQTTQK